MLSVNHTGWESIGGYPVNTGFPSSDCGGLLLSGRTAFTTRRSPRSLKLLITTQQGINSLKALYFHGYPSATRSSWMNYLQISQAQKCRPWGEPREWNLCKQRKSGKWQQLTTCSHPLACSTASEDSHLATQLDAGETITPVWHWSTAKSCSQWVTTILWHVRRPGAALTWCAAHEGFGKDTFFLPVTAAKCFWLALAYTAVVLCSFSDQGKK